MQANLYLIIHSWHPKVPNHQNIRNPWIFYNQILFIFCLLLDQKIRRIAEDFLLISWRHIKIHFTASLKKIITQNFVKKYLWFGENKLVVCCHELNLHFHEIHTFFLSSQFSMRWKFRKYLLKPTSISMRILNATSNCKMLTRLVR